MKCEMCGGNEATVRYTEVVNKKVVKMNLCEECAKKKGVTIQAPFTIADLLAGLTDLGLRAEEDMKKECPGCGLSYLEFRKTGRLGCGRCYGAFGASLKGLIETIHKSSRHVGKAPRKARAPADGHAALRELEEQLRAAVSGEEFEKAARLRDKIREMKEAAGEPAEAREGPPSKEEE